MGFNEFKELFTALNGWKQNFMMFDQDRSGTVEPHELNQALNTMGESDATVGGGLGFTGIHVEPLLNHFLSVHFNLLMNVVNAHGVTSDLSHYDDLQYVRKQRPDAFSPFSGYRVSPQTLNAIIKRYNKGGRIFFDDYVACCVKLRTLTGSALQSGVGAARR